MKKEIIADKATEIFSMKGYKATSLREISMKGNLSKGCIYHYFKNKEDILLYIFMRNSESGISKLEQTLKENKRLRLDPKKSLERMIKTYATHLLAHREISLLVLRERDQLSPKGRDALLAMERYLFRLVKSELRKSSSFRQGLDLSLVSFQLMSMIHWMGYWFDENGALSRLAAINQTIDILFNGLLK